MRLAPLALAALSVSLAAGIALAGDLAKAKNDLDAALKNVAAAKSEEDKDRAYDELRSACAPFSSEDSKEVPILLLDRAAKNDDAMARYFLRGTAAGVRGKLALEALGKAIVERQKDTDLALDLVKGIAGTSEGTAALAFVLEKGSTAVQKAAIARLGTFPTVESLDALVAALGRGDRELETPLRSELVTIAGEDKGKAPAWAAWWNEQRKSGVPERKAPPPAPPPAADGGKKPPRHVIVLADSGPRSKPDEGDADTDRIQD
ncbi:hypothetical protein HY251_20890, partial [bacterium]|nr:hypothetical protein [bacterium]